LRNYCVNKGVTGANNFIYWNKTYFECYIGHLVESILTVLTHLTSYTSVTFFFKT